MCRHTSPSGCQRGSWGTPTSDSISGKNRTRPVARSSSNPMDGRTPSRRCLRNSPRIRSGASSARSRRPARETSSRSGSSSKRAANCAARSPRRGSSRKLRRVGDAESPRDEVFPASVRVEDFAGEGVEAHRVDAEVAPAGGRRRSRGPARSRRRTLDVPAPSCCRGAAARSRRRVRRCAPPRTIARPSWCGRTTRGPTRPARARARRPRRPRRSTSVRGGDRAPAPRRRAHGRPAFPAACAMSKRRGSTSLKSGRDTSAGAFFELSGGMMVPARDARGVPRTSPW